MSTFLGLGAALARVLAHAAAPSRVRRDSLPLGSFETAYWRPVAKTAAWRILLTAREFQRRSKRAGSRRGALGPCALDILELLLNVARKQRGRMEPSIAWIADKVAWGRSTVIKALSALRTHGFLDWTRRYVPVETGGVPGPTRKQVTSAYVVLMPRALAALIPMRRAEVDKTPAPPAAAAVPAVAVVGEVRDQTLRSLLADIVASRASRESRHGPGS